MGRGRRVKATSTNFTHYVNPEDRSHYVRVSRILAIVHNPGLSQWREIVGQAEADKRKEKAAEWGSEVHKITAEMDLGNPIADIPERSISMVMSYLGWREKAVEEVVWVEKTFYSKRYGFACTIDRVVRMRMAQVRQIADIKTGAWFDKKMYALQMAAYRIAYEEETGEKLGKTLILPFDKKLREMEELEPVVMNETNEGEVFLGLLRAYRYLTNEKWE